MSLFGNLTMVDYLFISLTVILLVYYYSIKTFLRFKNSGIKYIKPLPFFGNTLKVSLGYQNISMRHKELYDQLCDEKLTVVFGNRVPSFMIMDPELIQRIMVKDFSNFVNRGSLTDENLDPLWDNLVSLRGQRWRAVRQKLTPAFTSSKLKIMHQQFQECSNELNNYINEMAANKKPLDILETMSKYSTDVIGSCAFGLQFNSLKDPNSQFRKMGRDIFRITFRLKIRFLLRVIHDHLPTLLRIKIVDQKLEDFFINLVKDTISYREREKVERNDFIQLLMNLRKEDSKGTSDINENSENKQGSYQIKLDDKLLAANTFIFFIAGFETTALTMTLCLFELAINQDIQTKLRNEIIDIQKKYDDITSEAIKEMTYLDQVISESLRKYPPVGSLIRECTVPYRIQDTKIDIQKDDKILIPVYAIHHDPRYYPEPDKFDPERFTEENKAKRPHSTFLPFGDGPRNCIGLRFALLEIKVALTKLLSANIVKLNEETKLPIKWSARRLLNCPEQNILLDFIPTN